jgi:hypothetical protein
MRRRIGAGQSTFIPSRSLSPWWPVLKCLVSRTRSSGARCCIRDEEGASEPASKSGLQTTVSCCCSMAVVVVVNVTEKARLDYVMWGPEGRSQLSLRQGLERRIEMTSNRRATLSPGRAWRRLGYRPCDVRGTGGVTLVLALVRNLRTCSVVPREKVQAEDLRGRKYRNTEQGRPAP